MATPLHVRTARETPVQRLDTGARVGERRWDNDPKQLAGAHREAVVDALQSVEADAYIKTMVTAQFRRCVDDLNSAGRYLLYF